MKIHQIIFAYVQTILHTAKKNFQLSRHPSPIGNGWGIIDGKCQSVKNVLPALPASLPSQCAQSDEDRSDSDDIDGCSETDSTESENDD